MTTANSSPPNRAHRSNARTERRKIAAQPPQDGVAGGMAEGVVDCLEPVDVDGDEGDGLAVPARPVELFPEPRVDAAAVEEPGEGVDGHRPRESVPGPRRALAGEGEGGGRGQPPHPRQVGLVERPVAVAGRSGRRRRARPPAPPAAPRGTRRRETSTRVPPAPPPADPSSGRRVANARPMTPTPGATTEPVRGGAGEPRVAVTVSSAPASSGTASAARGAETAPAMVSTDELMEILPGAGELVDEAVHVHGAPSRPPPGPPRVRSLALVAPCLQSEQGPCQRPRRPTHRRRANLRARLRPDRPARPGEPPAIASGAPGVARKRSLTRRTPRHRGCRVSSDEAAVYGAAAAAARPAPAGA